MKLSDEAFPYSFRECILDMIIIMYMMHMITMIPMTHIHDSNSHNHNHTHRGRRSGVPFRGRHGADPPWSDRHVAFVAFGAALGAREGIPFSLLLILSFLLDYWITRIPNGREPRRQGYRRASRVPRVNEPPHRCAKLLR